MKIRVYCLKTKPPVEDDDDGDDEDDDDDEDDADEVTLLLLCGTVSFEEMMNVYITLQRVTKNFNMVDFWALPIYYVNMSTPKKTLTQLQYIFIPKIIKVLVQ